MFPKSKPIETQTDIQNYLTQALKEDRASRDFCALECLANDLAYAKPDSQKMFLLWEANIQDGIRIRKNETSAVKHQWVYALFIHDGIVRFPFNTFDTNGLTSLSWLTIAPPPKTDDFVKRFLVLPRWSTASRSCLALIPEKIGQLTRIDASGWTIQDWKNFLGQNPDLQDWEEFLGQRSDLQGYTGLVDLTHPQPKVCVPEWADREYNRFCKVVKAKEGMGALSAPKGVFRQLDPNKPYGRYRLYSIKTGVKYVGSMDESRTGKDHLEANCELAMSRSEVIEGMPNNDLTFGVQTEVLTITATLSEGGRDGFQVRDLSCMNQGLDFIPGQAIPYARAVFDGKRLEDFYDPKISYSQLLMNFIDSQYKFWRKNFAVPLGRAKARLFLNYGLIHTSANAQNFLLGFKGNVLGQFVARDLGDTSWHDDFIGRYAMSTRLYSAYKDEKVSDTRHLLHETSSGAYPPPHMIRLAAYSVLTHEFANKLIQNHRWNQSQLYLFATGILDGFREFMEEALLLPRLPDPGDHGLSEGTIKDYGVRGKYPADMSKLDAYRSLVDELLKNDAKTLFYLAADVRKCGENAANTNTLDQFQVDNADGINVLINAEEILLCAGFEVLLVTKPIEETERAVKGRLETLFSGNWPRVVKGDGR